MKLTRFQLFAQRAADLLDSIPSAILLTSFYHYNDVWHDSLSFPIEDRAVIDKLDKCRTSSSKLYRGKNSDCCYFSVPQIDAAIVVKYKSPPRKPTPSKTSELLGQCLIESTNEYRATHDALTGLLNGEAFRMHLASRFTELSQAHNENSLLPSNSIAVIMADLDFFKQVNDSHGHLFGDLVLATLAQNFEQTATRWEEARGGTHVTVSRVSGEEFYFMIEGSSSDGELVELAEELREGLKKNSLPPRNHQLLAEDRYRKLQLPPENECFRTASFGISSRQVAGANADPDIITSRLMNEADVGVIRAKAGGRDRVVQFREIVKSHGRILLHHSETNVVAIDIGRQVGVRKGQEFTVAV